MKKKTKRLVKFIEEFKEGKRCVEDVTLQIESLKRTANKAFKKNYNVQKIMEQANRKIDAYMDSLTKYGSKRYAKSLQPGKIRLIESIDIENQCNLIKIFLDDLRNYEDQDYNEDSEKLQPLINKDFSVFRVLQEGNQSQSNTTRDDFDIESKILFAYICIFCGCLLARIPTSFTREAGALLIARGTKVLLDDKSDIMEVLIGS